MKKRGIMILLLSGLIFSRKLPVRAETFYGDADWRVDFTDEKEMVSSFTSSDINDMVLGMQPGDNVIIRLALKNQNDRTTDWYMQNEVLYSLEDRSANREIGGGAYAYRLSYTDKDGTVTPLFDSDTVGGESVSAAGQGLKEATNALKDYFYLDTLAKGQDGLITLEVALDGETNGNAYQSTLADLQMKFAVELRSTPSGRTPEPGDPSVPLRTQIVQTGDNSRLLLYTILMAVSGAALLLLALFQWKDYRRRKEE